MGAYIGRYHRVREMNAMGEVGPALVLDRKSMDLKPYINEDWWRHTSGIYLPVLSGGLGFSGAIQTPRTAFLAVAFASGAQQTTALNSAYASGSTGNAIGARTVLQATKTLTNIYCFITAYTGTAANVNDLNWELRTATTAVQVNTAGGGLVATGTKDPASATGWINISGLSTAMSAGTLYFVIIGDADGNGTDSATVLNSHTGDPVASLLTGCDFAGSTTANGWTTTTVVARIANMVLAFSDGTVKGSPFTANAASNSTTNRRGLRMSGLSGDVKIYGIMANATNANISGMEIIYDDTAPGGAILANTTTNFLYSTAAAPIGAFLAAPYTLGRGIPYRLVLTYSGAATTPSKWSIGTGADANLKLAMIGGNGWYWAEANGTTDWSNDDAAAMPFMTIIIEDTSPNGRLTTIN